MNEFIFRTATENDISFIVDTIIEAEKSGTDILSYCTIFGLTEDETRKYISKMLQEETDGCELSISSYLVAESNGEIVAAVGAWIEGIDNLPSGFIKGSLLNYILPKKCLVNASVHNSIVQELSIENILNTIQIGVVYVVEAYRGRNLPALLINEQITRLKALKQDISEIYVQVFANNIPAIKAYGKINFKTVYTKEASNKNIIKYLPSDKKVLMKLDVK
jgi:ribosomal protein S18 acetylase RimI-like enzyme